MLKTILVTGKNGQLGESIQKIAVHYPSFQFTFVGRDELDLADSGRIASFFAGKKFDAIINCAAHTAVDRAESEPELADAINHLSVKQLAGIAKQTGAWLVHVSTDYVFDGRNYRPYVETDPVNPQSVYGATKLKGEQAIQQINPFGCIIRTSWVYSEFGNNFVKTMLRLGAERDQLNVIFDQVGSPTYAGDLAKAIMVLVEKNLVASETRASVDESLYHFSNEGVCSWYDFAQTIFELSEINCQVSPIETKDYPTPASRPHYSLLNKAKIKADYAIAIPYWKQALRECMQQLQDND